MNLLYLAKSKRQKAQNIGFLLERVHLHENESWEGEKYYVMKFIIELVIFVIVEKEDCFRITCEISEVIYFVEKFIQ